MRKSLSLLLIILVIATGSFAATGLPPSMPGMGSSIFPEGDMPELDVKELEELTKLFFPDYDEKQRKELITETQRLDDRMRKMSPEDRIAEQKKMEQELESFLTKELETLEQEEKSPVAPVEPKPAIAEEPKLEQEKVTTQKSTIPPASTAALAQAKKKITALLASIAEFRLKISSLARISADVPTEATWARIQPMLNDLVAYATIVRNKEPLLNILVSDEFKTLYNQLQQLSSTLSTQGTQVVIPDTYKLPALDDNEAARATIIDRATKKKSQAAVRTIIATIAGALEQQQLSWSLKRLIQKYAPEELKKVAQNGKPAIAPGGTLGGFGTPSTGQFGGGFGGGYRPSSGGFGGFGGGLGGAGGAGMPFQPSAAPAGAGKGVTPPGSSQGKQQEGGKKEEEKGAKKEERDKGERSKEGKSEEKGKEKKKEGFKKPTKQLQELNESIDTIANTITTNRILELVAPLATAPETDIRTIGRGIEPLALALKTELEEKAEKLHREIVKAPEKEQSKLYAEAYKKFVAARPIQQFASSLHQSLQQRPLPATNLAAAPIATALQAITNTRNFLLDAPGKNIIALQQQLQAIRPQVANAPIAAEQKTAMLKSVDELLALDPLSGEAATRAKTIIDAQKFVQEITPLLTQATAAASTAQP
ncbi:hypothetical protein M1466_02610 [Candidatus Dependentiae bacterium]|nr:hypothetical protein [Candidatus Dependentiae bacterium]